MTTTPKAPRRRIRQNVWGNWYGYAGTRRVEAFTDELEAKEWLATGASRPPVPPGPIRLRGLES